MEPFLDRFLSVLQRAPKGSLVELLDLFHQAQISHYMDVCPIQDSLRYRARHLGLRVANLIVDEKGDLDLGMVERLVGLLHQGIYLLGPRREGDVFLYHHLLWALQSLQGPEVAAMVRKFSPPIVHKKAEELIRATLWPEKVRVVQTTHVRRAALAAWFTLLRQTTGSCFATAPAILIQKDPMKFLKDLYDLLTTGRLKRIVGGKEYAVPLSLNVGTIDLRKPLGPFLDNLPYSPALIAALEAGGLLSPDQSLEQKMGELGHLLREREPVAHIEALIRGLLMDAADLTEEDIRDEEHLSEIQMAPLLAKNMAIHYQRPTERGQKVSDWKKRVAKACIAFQSYADCALLRSWEYTLASFCDVKLDFARWNLFVGLGLHSEEKGGIGHFIYQNLTRKLQQLNEEAAGYNQEFEINMGAARAVDRGTQEHNMYMTTANQAAARRDEAVESAQALSKFFPLLIEQYDQKLQENFQELFDPSLFEAEAHLYEDSPAGFRLVYKHGRSDSSQWTSIHSGEEYVQALRDFFSTTEADIQTPPSLDRELLSELTTGIIQWIQDPIFLKSAIERSREKGRHSPWDYISGGTMETLLQAYWERNGAFKEAMVVPHSEEELMEFLKRHGKEGPLLIHSPTHAFIFYPPQSWEIKRWDTNRKLDEEMQEHLAHRFSERIPEKERALFLHLFRQKQSVETISQFRAHLMELVKMKHVASEVDSFLYEHTPLFPLEVAKAGIRSMFSRFPNVPEAKVREALDGIHSAFLSPSEIQQKAKEIVFDLSRSPFSPIDWDGEIANAARVAGLSYPTPILFADSNWSGWLFGFLVNPETNRLELWRLNRTATQGYPMHDWKEWLSEKNTSAWILLTNLKEYS